jgi:hypothetical protein
MLDVLLLEYDVNNQFHNLFPLKVFEADHFHLVIPGNKNFQTLRIDQYSLLEFVHSDFLVDLR